VKSFVAAFALLAAFIGLAWVTGRGALIDVLLVSGLILTYSRNPSGENWYLTFWRRLKAWAWLAPLVVVMAIAPGYVLRGQLDYEWLKRVPTLFALFLLGHELFGRLKMFLERRR
jgi:hypothetical protein